MNITAIIYEVDLKNKMLSIKKDNRLYFFNLRNYIYKAYKRYLYSGNYISFNYEDKYFIKGKYKLRNISFIHEVSVPGRYFKDILYSKINADKELKSFLNNLDYKLFVDIEMSMPSFDSKVAFESEVIQVGMLLVDKDNEVVEKYNYYVRPSKYRFLTKRTEKFLNITYRDIMENGVSYYKFYNKFKQILNNYHPAIITFGKNDKLFLEKSYKTNNLPSLSRLSRFVNVNQLIKNYYELDKDPGLFYLYQKYFDVTLEKQKHDASQDASVTLDIYNMFYLDVLNNTNIFEK